MDAVILLSGGIDSSACIKFYLDLSYKVECIFCNYGQPAADAELAAAQSITKFYNVCLHIITTSSMMIPNSGEICGRNALLIIQALCFKGFGTYKIILGIHDGTSYADCSSNFVKIINYLLDFYGNGTIYLEAPFITWNKLEISLYCKKNFVPYHLTYSCETGHIPPCGICKSCLDRKEFFNE